MTALSEAQNGDAVVPAAPPSPRRFQIVVAAFASDSGIGRGGTLPWRRLPNDMALFREITLATEDKQKQYQKQRPTQRQRRNAVVMGRKTFDSIPSKFRPLPGRLNVVLSRQRRRAGEGQGEGLDLPEGVLHAGSLEEALCVLGEEPWVDEIERVFVIGGAQVYREALESPHCEAIHITHVFPRSDAEEGSSPPPPCDTFFPDIPRETFRVWCTTPKAADGDDFVTSFTCFVRQRGSSPKQQKQNGCVLPQQPSGGTNGSNGNHTAGESSAAALAGTKAQVAVVGGEAVTAAVAEAGAVLPRVVRERHEEYQYLRLVDDILATGTRKGDRTGTGTIAKFGCQLRFDLRDTFPLLTTKRVFWRGVVEELLWFVAGSTNANLLKEKGVHIWDGNGSRAFLDSLGFTEREEGDLGPVYGFQWRHFGAEYTHMHASYEGQGVDQLADVVRKIRHTPNDRRIVLSAWNPSHLHLMALPPCHLLAQFFVADGTLSCQMYQRSCDTGLGVPFNIASYALLTHMLAHVCGLVPGEFVHVLGDAHVYSNHVAPLKQQLRNMPRPFPVLKIRRAVKEIDEFQFDDFELEGYEPHKKIAMEMAV